VEIFTTKAKKIVFATTGAGMNHIFHFYAAKGLLMRLLHNN